MGRHARWLLVALLLSGCDRILGIEEPRLASDGGPDARPDGTTPIDSASPPDGSWLSDARPDSFSPSPDARWWPDGYSPPPDSSPPHDAFTPIPDAVISWPDAYSPPPRDAAVPPG